ncbi:sporulation integral membrane protein YlbJ [Caldisalinibacter kiritimatiensis]|uniref:Membrane protein n=1 Tax=Caldisalinibacter kiritimatiensis TaxID=1304284 RepID=R1AUQ8_9FIRM|nr:sporulation integral membrane protein YlbJ [Caldisalinibacter kiritimatiensis]EOD00888.1 Membrane protein [Caldisalinibacter kiritimatiensis]
MLPSLLPFFILSEILIGLGIVDFIGTLLQPLMKPIFNVPGEGAFPFVMSITSGYPVGVKITSKLLCENKINKIQAQRLVSFCSTSGPLFMIGAVSIGMFHNTAIGSLIALSHYLGAITVGLIFRFYKINEGYISKAKQKYSIKDAFINLSKARKKDGRSLGELMGDSVKESIDTMLIVGGFIILYSVIIEILSLSNILDFICKLFTILFPINNTELLKGLISGMIEITNGCRIVANVNTSNLLIKISTASFIIGWSGFSIHSQSASIISKTDINLIIYMIAKFFHGLFSSLYTYILYILVFKNQVISSFNFNNYNTLNFTPSFISTLTFSIKLFLMLLISLLIISIIFFILNTIKERYNI